MMNQLLKLIKRDPQSLREKEIRCEENALKKTKPVDLVENTLENNRNSAMNFNKDMNGINVLYTNYGMLFVIDEHAYIINKGSARTGEIRGRFDLREITPETIKNIDILPTWDNRPIINSYASGGVLKRITEQSRPISGEESKQILEKLGYTPKRVYYELTSMDPNDRNAVFTELGFNKSELSDLM